MCLCLQSALLELKLTTSAPPSTIHPSPLPRLSRFPCSWLSWSMVLLKQGVWAQSNRKKLWLQNLFAELSEETRLDFFAFSHLLLPSSLSSTVAGKRWHCLQFECLVCVLGKIILLQRDNNYLPTCSIGALIQSHSPAVTIIQRWWWWLWREERREAEFTLPAIMSDDSSQFGLLWQCTSVFLGLSLGWCLGGIICLSH